MRTLKLDLNKRSYNIIIGAGILGGLGRQIRRLDIGSDAYVITNPFIRNKYGPLLDRTLTASGFTVKFRNIPDTEKSKSMEVASSVINDITCYDKKKDIFIVAFGGGVIGDLSGFIASIYKRGIPYIQVPTTLLAQVDSAIGGKTAVDLSRGKNLVGAFYQPRLVYSDVRVIRTLDKRQVRSGLAEIIKYGIIKDPRLFGYLEKKYRDILNLNPAALEFTVMRSSRIKALVVRQDERETKGVRTILNFGHTIGHAIEAAAGFKSYTHGEAVALGMLVASDISRELNLSDAATVKRIEGLIRSAGLPTTIKGVSVGRIIKMHYRDKKFSGPENKFVLVERIGRIKIVKNVPLEAIRRALRERTG
ncbi:MAG: 3-dehydroquinate synthase [Candidatus Omnitrophota bacterium]